MATLENRSTSAVYYHNFRGVDFSSDHTTVDNSRFSYLCNMYKDYQSGQGIAIETIPGFRELFDLDGKINGLHTYYSKLDGGRNLLLIHAGTKLYRFPGVGLNIIEEVAGLAVDDSKSTSFVFGDYIYIICNENEIISYRRAEEKGDSGEIEIVDECSTLGYRTYVPTTYINRKPDYSDKGDEYQPKNMLNPFYYIAYKSDGTSVDYYVDEQIYLDPNWTGQATVYIDGATSAQHPKYDSNNKKITFDPPPREGATVKVLMRDAVTIDGVNADGIIKGCTIATVHDNRVFLSGNPKFPNRYFYSMKDDPTYFGELNWGDVGSSPSAITGLLPLADVVAVLKDDNASDGCVNYLTRYETGNDIVPVAYRLESGLGGIGCIGAYTNFFDDPVFISKLGLEAIGQLSVRYERAIEHRSTMVDAKLARFSRSELSNARMVEWNGYLLILINGQIFMADSRQRWTDNLGNAQYEWYYLEDIGVYDGQEGTTYTGKDDNTGEVTNVVGAPYTGGTFYPATEICVYNDNIYFGCENGSVCCFNFDLRTEYGDFPKSAYSFNGRAIWSGVATKMDNCGIPHLAKSTVKKSTVIKTRSMQSAAMTVKVRTNKDPYKMVGRVNTNTLNFDDMNFADFSFLPEGESIFPMKEKEKQWVEKQYLIYSDEFEKPFSLHYITYQYYVQGRIK